MIHTAGSVYPGHKVEAENKGKIVAIDIETGEYALGDDVLTASQALFDRNEDAQVWVVRVGDPAVHRIAPCSVAKL
ncbi:MAG TPA: hypothetical protein VFB38_12740 [Chthonomonadaceae bacterium]|nr:hypothetical protein [Chthonomonadaceae bacterium]